ncbi:MAG: peptidase M15A [Oscillatoriaceae bacterium SKW80]|nr:peptidase M15A [Oscillatoriaceae bacterium SKYG93]MCX8120271.1 peptidase M15A [Oscillatoriaceae bacterium SKW80]MDW8453197.1 peptidase M15A [Oscillatoriaceae cyanobacterium SKYGB_i_bin93]HIK28891.1 peptidase M15A [Oscillatoriaceae cyanobacterium M7585_C2015_266]
MAKILAEQRNELYLQEAARSGIHKPILAALYLAHNQPALVDGETGLGISPANRISLEEVNTLPKQIYYAANTIRSLSESLAVQGWTASDFWHADKGCYTEKFIKAVAAGYAAPANDTSAARLETCDSERLLQAYLQDYSADCAEIKDFPKSQVYLDGALKTLVSQLPRYYMGLPYQREGLLQAACIWNRWYTPTEALAKLKETLPQEKNINDESHIDRQLLQFIEQIPNNYSEYPHQREALLRLTQLWRQLESREAAIVSLKQNTSPEPSLTILDAALIAFCQRVLQEYRGQAKERNALVEAIRIWRQLESRTAALVSLGINIEILEAGKNEPAVLINTAAQLDREILDFVRRIPIDYKELDYQREAALALVQLWRQQATKEQAIQSLVEDLKQMNLARKGSLEAPPIPFAYPQQRPERWTPDNLQMHAPIIPDGTFTWAEATRAGIYMPTDIATVNAIVRIAELAERARARLGRCFYIIDWYYPRNSDHRQSSHPENSRHAVGDAIVFYCDGLSANQVYWFLDPWWPGGLGRYTDYPYLTYIDARSYRSRWVH